MKIKKNQTHIFFFIIIKELIISVKKIKSESLVFIFVPKFFFCLSVECISSFVKIGTAAPAVTAAMVAKWSDGYASLMPFATNWTNGKNWIEMKWYIKFVSLLSFFLYSLDYDTRTVWACIGLKFDIAHCAFMYSVFLISCLFACFSLYFTLPFFSSGKKCTHTHSCTYTRNLSPLKKKQKMEGKKHYCRSNEFYHHDWKWKNAMCQLTNVMMDTNSARKGGNRIHPKIFLLLIWDNQRIQDEKNMMKTKKSLDTTETFHGFWCVQEREREKDCVNVLHKLLLCSHIDGRS